VLSRIPGVASPEMELPELDSVPVERSEEVALAAR
jgi:hypothetical protein